MKTLVVGGTGFLGGAITEACVAAGNQVAVLSRRSAAEVRKADIEILTGDRHHDLSALQGRRFDLVFDTCGYAPDDVDTLLDALAPFHGRYIFISSASVYGDYSHRPITEDIYAPRAAPEHLALAHALPLEERARAEAYGEAYGPLKRECELRAIERLGDRALILRSGLLVGAGDYTDRLTWWIRRIDLGGLMPIPGRPERLIQLIDVRDAAAFAYRGAKNGFDGIHNLTSRPFSMARLLDMAKDISNSDAQFAWIDSDKVAASGLAAWTEIPLWLPTTSEKYRHFFEIDVEKAHAAGLETLPLEETLADILAWDRGRRDRSLRCGMSQAQERLLLTGEGPDGL